MDVSSLPIFGVLQNKLRYHSERQALLAQNIANADTPAYKAQDVAKPDFKKFVEGMSASKKVGMAVTSPQHMSSKTQTMEFKAEARPMTGELNPNGNNVMLEEEMMNVATNQSEYQRALLIYRKMISMMNIAIGKPSNG
ncbi:MAG: flagellar basal body rod protein FlgB [Rickettsiales bacterium]|nr:flagellar basal body rod protein FlgB [Rickettsiales bacterium]